jgi:hypothetical protein
MDGWQRNYRLRNMVYLGPWWPRRTKQQWKRLETWEAFARRHSKRSRRPSPGGRR